MLPAAVQIERFPDAAAVARRGADLVAGLLSSKPDAVLLVPAGSTPVPLYAELARRVRTRELDASRAHFFQLDELVGVPPHDERSFHAHFRRCLVRPLDLGHGFHGLDGSAREPEREIEGHRRALESLGGADLVLLGLGLNGHVAFNEPGSRAGDRARVVALDATTRESLGTSFADGRVPEHGLTLGLSEIAAADAVVLLVTGASKAAVLADVAGATPDPALPATLLAGHRACRVLADRSACARLPAL